MLQTTDLIGYIAACLTTGAFIPQAWMTWRRKRAEGVSLGMYVLMVTGISMWLTYGILLQAWPVIIANFITMLLALFILGMKLIYK
ncbi:SemiSWEET transporter [Undibacterium oligocarboniphilum]|uniref:SemiSWEET transporter n=1 Tax=Undibacterium oligocarboniphilum TaxID=666702 RepID=UPI001C40979F|nr:SemiSWEET transporter [Undibacterium oligocarboniphilum]